MVCYLSCGGFPISEHMGERWDDVDGEADEEGADGGVDGAKEGEDYGQEPYGNDDRQASKRPQANASGVVHPYHLLPHEVQRRAREPERNKLHPSIFRLRNLSSVISK